jgi:hypothetical protein
MKHINSTELFDIFLQQDNHIFYQESVREQVDNAFITFGTIITTIQNYYLIDQIYIHKYAKHYDSVRESLKMKYFNGVMKYFDRIDVLQPDTVDALIDEFTKSTITSTLQLLITLYEQQEHYENCAIIFKYLQIFL